MIFLTLPCFLVFGFFVIITSQAGTDVEALRGGRPGRKSQLSPKVQSLSVLDNTSKRVGPSGLFQTGPTAPTRQKKWGPTPTLRLEDPMGPLTKSFAEKIKTNPPRPRGKRTRIECPYAYAGRNRAGRGNLAQTILRGDADSC